MKEYLLVLLVLLFAWSNRDRVPAEYQFWRHNDTYVKVVNNSDQDLTDVKVVVWSAPHLLVAHAPLPGQDFWLGSVTRAPSRRAGF